MNIVPREIEKYLIKGEIFERIYKLRDGTVYVTDKRLLIEQGDIISPFAYSHIKNIRHKKCRRCVMLFGGILLIIIAIGVMQILNLLWWNPPVSGLILAGVLIFIAGFVSQKRIELLVTGQSSPLILPKMEGYEIGSLTRLIVERIT